MKKLLIVLLALVFVANIAFAGGAQETTGTTGNEQFEKVNLKMSTVGTEQGLDTQAARRLAETVKQETGGRIQIEVYPTDQLAGGDMTKSIELLVNGTTDIMITSAGILSSINDVLMVSSIPWTFSSYEDANKVISASGAKFWTDALATRGIQYMSYIHNGLRQLTNNKRPIKTPADLKNVKIRVPGGNLYMDTMKALGADPIAMNWGEVFTSLQQGTIDGQENGVTVTNSFNLFEVQKYITIWNYIYECNLCIFNQKTFAKLQPKTQEYLTAKIEEACGWARQQVEDNEEVLKAKFVSEGMELYELSESEMNAFKVLVAPVIESYKKRFGEEACKAFNII